MHIEKTFKETWPETKLIGKRFTNEDRDEQNTFSAHWQACYREDWMGQLKGCPVAPGVAPDPLGGMRMTSADDFEYWIGALFSPEAEAPAGFASVVIPAGDVGVCYLRGDPDNGELYGMEASDLAMAALAEQDMHGRADNWFFERYNMARFMQKDAAGEVVLDICMALD